MKIIESYIVYLENKGFCKLFRCIDDTTKGVEQWYLENDEGLGVIRGFDANMLLLSSK